MRPTMILIAAMTALAMGACAKKAEQVSASSPPPPVMPGSVAGSTAADRDGDGIVDGYYSADGIYHPNALPAPAPVQPAVMVSRRGERG